MRNACDEASMCVCVYIDIEQQHMPFQTCRGAGNHNARSKEVPMEAIKVIVLKLHEIWQFEGKWHSDLDS